MIFYNTDDAIKLFVKRTDCTESQARRFINLTDIFESMCGVSKRYPELAIINNDGGRSIDEEKRIRFILLASKIPKGLVKKLISVEYEYLNIIGCISKTEYKELLMEVNSNEVFQ